MAWVLRLSPKIIVAWGPTSLSQILPRGYFASPSWRSNMSSFLARRSSGAINTNYDSALEVFRVLGTDALCNEQMLRIVSYCLIDIICNNCLRT